MQKSQVVTAIETTPKGANIIVEWVRDCKVKKAVTDKITKSVRMIGRMGIDYDNMASVQAKRESGELPAENKGLPWGTWDIFPFMIEHKGAYYLRLYAGTSDKVKPEVHFFRNGQEVSKESIKADCLASETEEKTGDCFCCKVENMTRIHNESEWLMVVVGNIGQEKVAVTEPIPSKVLATL